MGAFVNQGLWIASGLLLFVIAIVRFNRPPTNRSGTTFLLFYTGALFYYALLIAIWLLVILLITGGGYGFDQLGVWINKSLNLNTQLAPSMPVVGLLFIVVSSQFKLVRKMDAAARSFCIQLAAIPTEAEQLAMELARGAHLQILNQKLLDSVSREISKNIGRNALNFDNDGTPASRFTRAVSLFWLFIMPDNAGTPPPFPVNASSRSTYTRIMRLNEKPVQQSVMLYESLMENGLAYFTSSKPTRQMNESLKLSVQELSQTICSLIARYVLFQDITSNQRRRRLSSMGLNARDHLPAFGWDQWMASTLAVIILFLFMSIALPSTQSFSQNFIYSILAAIQLGIAVIGGTIVAQWSIRRNEGVGGQFPPLAELTLAGLVVIGLCMILRLGWPLIPSFFNTGSIAVSASLEEFKNRWPFVLILPFVCTMSIGILCGYLGPLTWGWIRLAFVGGALNGIAFLIGGILISDLLDEGFLGRVLPVQSISPKIFIVSTTGVTGIILGAIVLVLFSKSMRSVQTGADSGGTASLSGSGAPAYELSWEDLTETDVNFPRGASTELGGYNRSNVAELEGRYLCFRPLFSKADVINAYQMTIDWDDKRACLAFEEQNRLDARHTQKGQVFIPEGKPFMSLVTIDKGAIRVIMVSRPDETGLARGLVMTLSNPGGLNFIPATAPICLQRLGKQNPQVGFVRPGEPDYQTFLSQLASVLPDFGTFAGAKLGLEVTPGLEINNIHLVASNP
jgi:hypothetical protein